MRRSKHARTNGKYRKIATNLGELTLKRLAQALTQADLGKRLLN